MEHDLKIEKDLKFQNNEEFLIWKSKEENSKICKFVQHRGAEKRWTVDFTTTTYWSMLKDRDETAKTFVGRKKLQ
ncbi:hypothetical protein TNCV_306711 [Trichonephila clavipes]|nr:hypothetical protein TNCV_306711 [Trichonephila clavipes]